MAEVTTLTEPVGYTALCLWEACLEQGNDGLRELADVYRSKFGAAQLRDEVLCRFAPACHAEYAADLTADPSSHDLITFDWDYCPHWLLTRVDWENWDEFGPLLRKL